MKVLKWILIGIEFFKERIDTQSYYIDKTQLISNIIDEKWCCLLDIKYEYAFLFFFPDFKKYGSIFYRSEDPLNQLENNCF